MLKMSACSSHIKLMLVVGLPIPLMECGHPMSSGAGSLVAMAKAAQLVKK